MYYVYVIQSFKDGTLYKGMTSNLSRRLREHSLGQSRFTRPRRPHKLVYFEEVKDRRTARKREKWLKSGQGREFLKDILKNNPR